MEDLEKKIECIELLKETNFFDTKYLLNSIYGAYGRMSNNFILKIRLENRKRKINDFLTNEN